MSKKTDKSKEQGQRRPRAHHKKRRGKRPNPISAIAELHQLSGSRRPGSSSLFDDPIALHHLAGFVLRMLELYEPRKDAPPFAGFIQPPCLINTSTEPIAGTDSSKEPGESDPYKDAE